MWKSSVSICGRLSALELRAQHMYLNSIRPISKWLLLHIGKTFKHIFLVCSSSALLALSQRLESMQRNLFSDVLCYRCKLITNIATTEFNMNIILNSVVSALLRHCIFSTIYVDCRYLFVSFVYQHVSRVLPIFAVKIRSNSSHEGNSPHRMVCGDKRRIFIIFTWFH